MTIYVQFHWDCPNCGLRHTWTRESEDSPVVGEPETVVCCKSGDTRGCGSMPEIVFQAENFDELLIGMDALNAADGDGRR